jgi:AcrR family transcriptional regulator
MLTATTFSLWKHVAIVNIVSVEFIARPVSMKSSRPYHHGNLRGALFQAALELIIEVGPAAFTLREVARRAGVSHNAPYRHFADKDALLAAVATQGFQELTEAMLQSTTTETTALERLKQSGLAYVSFALRRPEYFSVMFDIPTVQSSYLECRQAAEEAFSVLVGFVESSREELHLISGDTKEYALTAWSLVHGIAKLAVGKQFPYQSAEEVLRFAGVAIDSFALQARS